MITSTQIRIQVIIINLTSTSPLLNRNTKWHPSQKLREYSGVPSTFYTYRMVDGKIEVAAS
jgi:hypothetical protein